MAAEQGLGRTLDEILGQLRRLLEVSGCAFQVVDRESGRIEAAASWFINEEADAAFTPLLNRHYEADRPGVTETAVERGEPVHIPDVAAWGPADRMRERLRERLGDAAAQRTWAWYERSTFVACPVLTETGRTLGVLVISSSRPQPPLRREDVRVIEVFAGLAALALQRAELKDAAAEVTRSLEPQEVYEAIVAQTARLTGAEQVILTRWSPAAQELRPVAARTASERLRTARFRMGEGMIGEVARTGRPYVSRPEDAERFVSWITDEEVRSFLHVPLQLGPRLFGVLSAGSAREDAFGRRALDLLAELGHMAAGAIANALDFQRERRVATALARGYVPDTSAAPDGLPGVELGVVYEPAGHGASGGDVFGAWALPAGGMALLIGDVGGKGLEVAATSAMVRFFLEARTWDTPSPGTVLAQVDAVLRPRLPADVGMVTACLAILDGGRLRWANAGHPPPLAISADGYQRELEGTGLPLGVDEGGTWEERELELSREDVLFACTDGVLEARRDGAFFGTEELPMLLEEHAPHLDPQPLCDLVHARVEAWAPVLHDDLAILALRRR